MTRSQIKDVIWHCGKTMICAIQFWILSLLISNDFQDLLTIEGDAAPTFDFILLLYPAILIGFFVALWRYYDTIDDRSFNKVCKAEVPPKFLEDPAYLAGIGLTALTVSPSLAMAFRPFYRALGAGYGATAAAILSALVVTAGGSALRIARLNQLWILQSKIPHAKPPSIPGRICYAVFYFIALLLIAGGILIGVAVATMIVIGLFVPLLIITGVILLLLFVVLPALNCIPRRKFMQSLRKMQERGKISVTVHGHPYLSLFIGRVPFGLTITHVPHPDSQSPEPVTYLATFANCLRRREVVILCNHNVYQFMYSLKFNHVTRFARMGADQAQSRRVSLPGAAWFTNHSFDFPEGEGQPILLIDHTPVTLAVRSELDNELFQLDNASSVFGYTVYGKNAFLRLLERL